MEKARQKATLLPLEIRVVVEQAKKVIKGDLDSSMSDLMLIGTSAGGACAKGLIGWNRKTDEIVAGVVMSEVHILHENGRSHFMTKRFDRQGGKKIHMHSLCGMIEVDYNEHRLFDYVNLAREVLRRTGSYQDLEQVFRRTVFNLLARNQDDHLKNFAFLMDEKGLWNLAPAYDLCFSVGGWCDDNQLTFDGKLGQNVKLSDLFSIAEKLGIKKSSDIIKQVSAAILKWTDLAKKNNVSPKYISKIQKAHDDRRESVGIKTRRGRLI